MDKPFAITLDPGSSRANHTGAWRTERPLFISALPPCNNACPAGENIQQWLYQAEEGGLPNYEAAWRQIMADNPFPAIMGRVCYRPCETACNRAQLDQAVGINSVERFLGDQAIAQGWPVQAPPEGGPRTPREGETPAAAALTGEGGRGGGRRVLVVGAGPSGLSAAYHLTRLGHTVTVKDAGTQPGGMMRYGIPKYRLPRDVMDAEIDRILRMGVTLELNTTVTDIVAELTEAAGGSAGEDGFDAAFVAVGAHIGTRAYIPAGDSAKIMDAVSLLHSVAESQGVADGTPPMLGRRVAVYGGGNTAMDAARTARRLGAAEAVVVYRRTRDRMPAHDIEVTEALDEGVTMRWLSTITHADGGSLTIEKMRLDDTGFPQPTGELSADCLVLALGQDADLAVLDGVPGVTFSGGTVDVAKDLMTGYSRPGLAAYDSLNTWYYADAPAAVRPELEAARRLTTFDEVTGGLDASTALFEARRCMSCGNCFGCDNCYGACPDNAVIKQETGKYVIDYDYCKGCGMCAAECPCGAIVMVPEET